MLGKAESTGELIRKAAPWLDGRLSGGEEEGGKP